MGSQLRVRLSRKGTNLRSLFRKKYLQLLEVGLNLSSDCSNNACPTHTLAESSALRLETLHLHIIYLLVGHHTFSSSYVLVTLVWKCAPSSQGTPVLSLTTEQGCGTADQPGSIARTRYRQIPVAQSTPRACACLGQDREPEEAQQ